MTAFRQLDVFVENLAVAAWYIDPSGIPNLRVAGTTEYVFAGSIGVRRYECCRARKILEAVKTTG